MQLDCVTITGADDDVDPADLLALSAEFPFVEFGVLFAKGRTGPRYPGRRWVDELLKLPISNLSAHLCGGYVRDLVEHRNFSWLHEFDSPCFDRVQLNMTESMYSKINLDNLLMDASGGEGASHVFILQTKGFARAEEVVKFQYDAGGGPIFDMLHDPSGGRGIAPDSWPPPIPKMLCGYAGGINPTNIAAVLTQLQSLCTKSTQIWIDMESGVRDGDRFSLHKARECLMVAERFIDG